VEKHSSGARVMHKAWCTHRPRRLHVESKMNDHPIETFQFKSLNVNYSH